jgi:hypothetical protein
MTGPEHYAEAERLLAVADRHTSGVTYGPEWTLNRPEFRRGLIERTIGSWQEGLRTRGR